VRTITLSLDRALLPDLQDLANATWDAGDLDLFVVVRTATAQLRALDRGAATVRLTLGAAGHLMRAVPELRDRIDILLAAEAEEYRANRRPERRDRATVRQTRRFLCARLGDTA
jgi:hypothetical protein